VKLLDFDLSVRYRDAPWGAEPCTVGFTPPELCGGIEVSTNSLIDAWSTGILLLQEVGVAPYLISFVK